MQSVSKQKALCPHFKKSDTRTCMRATTSLIILKNTQVWPFWKWKALQDMGESIEESCIKKLGNCRLVFFLSRCSFILNKLSIQGTIHKSTKLLASEVFNTKPSHELIYLCFKLLSYLRIIACFQRKITLEDFT